MKTAVDADLHEEAGSSEGCRSDFLVAAGLSALFLAPLLVFGPFNVEQYHNGHPAVRVFHEGLFEGRFRLWTDAFGLGTPLPLGENLAFHPLFLLEPLVGLRQVFSVFWMGHLTLGTFAMLRLARRLEIAPSVAWIVAFGFAASPVTSNYSYTDDWPSVFLAWTSFPVLVHLAIRVAGSRSGREALPRSSALAACLAAVVWNSHLGYWLVPASMFLLFCAVLAGRRFLLWASFAAAAMASVAMTSERLYFIASEALRFPPYHERISDLPLAFGEWFWQLYRPLSVEVVGRLWSEGFFATLESYHRYYARLPFLGLVFSVAALWGVVSISQGPVRTLTDRVRLAAVVTFVVSVITSLLPSAVLFDAPSAMWLYRDPAVFFGLLLAGVGVTSMSARVSVPRLAVQAAMGIQAAQICLAVLPGVAEVVFASDRNVRFYKGGRSGAFEEWAASRTGGERLRTYLSPELARRLFSEQPLLADLGLLAAGDLERVGLEPVTARFKNVSMDALYPSLRQQHGMILSDASLFTDQASLDELGIEALLMLRSEHDLERLALLEGGRAFPLPDGDFIELFRNPRPRPRAGLFPPGLGALELPVRKECAVGGFLCLDLSGLAALRSSDEVEVSGGHGRLQLDLPSGERQRTLLLTQLHRPEWRAVAADGRELEVRAFREALLSVDVPAEVGSLSLHYRPVVRIALLRLGFSLFFLCVSMALFPFLRRLPRLVVSGSLSD